MKIDRDKQIHLLENLAKPPSAKTRDNAAKASNAQAATLTLDKVELSGWKNDLSALKEKVKAIPEVRAEKVAELQEALRTETYNVKGEIVARKILQSHLLDEIL